MTESSDTDLTQPSVVADLDGEYRQSCLMLTIAFHPNANRIGEVSSPCAEQKWILGRNNPDFHDPAEPIKQLSSRSLEDLCISRNALRLEYKEGSVTLGRASLACRCQINGRELDDELILSNAQLKEGVTIFLAYRVLLLLREVPGCHVNAVSPSFAPGLKGGSPYMGKLRRQIASVAASDHDVLIRGETGTGKELVASAIHSYSARARQKMVSVNMSAIPEALAPAALFGTAKGAYTGAETAGAGYFEQAQGGILFLDEIGDAPPEIQAQLLRALQQREIQRVGGPVQKIDLRVIAATDADLEEGSDFKAALRHRLSSCEIVLQPLREHPEDIGFLLWTFLQDYLEAAGKSHLLPGPDSDPFEVAAWAELFHTFQRYSWPGNVRQLSNYAHQVALASDPGLILPDNLRAQLQPTKIPATATKEKLRSSETVSGQEFLEAMAAARYEPKSAARILGISRTAVYRRIDGCRDLRIASQISQDELQEMLSACEDDLNRAALELRVSHSGLRSRLRAFGKPGK